MYECMEARKIHSAAFWYFGDIFQRESSEVIFDRDIQTGLFSKHLRRNLDEMLQKMFQEYGCPKRGRFCAYNELFSLVRVGIHKWSSTSQSTVLIRLAEMFFERKTGLQASKKLCRRSALWANYVILVYWKHVLGSLCRILTVQGREESEKHCFIILHIRDKYQYWPSKRV